MTDMTGMTKQEERELAKRLVAEIGRMAETAGRKLRFMASFGRYLTRARLDARRAGREFLVLGDFNIAHTRADLANPTANVRQPGFRPDEREWFGRLLGPRTLVDVVRTLHPDEVGPFSWWTWRGQAWAL